MAFEGLTQFQVDLLKTDLELEKENVFAMFVLV